LNKERCGFPVVSAFDSCGGSSPSAKEHLINSMLRDSYKPFGLDECLDVFTHYEAMEYLENKKPRVLYISYGETDDFAHAGRYEDYLNSANQVDKWLDMIWQYLQSTPQYKNKTALFVTVDHGRGDKKKTEWTSHGSEIQDAHEIWFALMGPGIAAKGEIKTPMQLYQKQFAQTMASLLGFTFKAEHPIGERIDAIK
jgi:bisphosphoglycerate-independent phosphoglycerate mutase (AlkP superfamily)